MPTDPNASDLTRRRFLAVAGSAVASSVVVANAGESAEALPPPPAKANTYTVVVDVSNGSFVYTATDANNTSVTANPLKVALQDFVFWKITSKGSKHHAAVHFGQGTPFVENAFHWNNQDDNPGPGPHAHGGQTQSADLYQYKYSIAVYDADPSVDQIFLDDPTIIVGGDGIEVPAKIIEATKELEAVRSRIQSIEKTLSEAVDRSKSKAVHQSNKK